MNFDTLTADYSFERNMFCFMPKTKIARYDVETPFEKGDLVVKRDGATYVGRVIDVIPPRNLTDIWRMRIRPIHASTGRTAGKARVCSMRAWKTASLLELLALQGE